MLKSKPESNVVLVTPDYAMALLEKNDRNRGISKYVLSNYVSDMENDRWQDSASQIQISSEGWLLNGQHRLHAVVQSGRSQYFTITRGLNSETQDVMDLGKTRTVADALSIRGVKNWHMVAASIRLHYGWQTGTPIKTFEGGRTGRTKAQEIELILKEKDQIPMLGEVMNMASRSTAAFRPLTGASAGAFLIEATRLPGTWEYARNFIEQVTTGERLFDRDPILVLRNRLNKMFFKLEKPRGERAVKLGLIVSAWNHYVDGNKVSTLRVYEHIQKMKQYRELPY
tara:strand:+ start:1780 stop:2631 length:852 start_codon:yes stop_codon:yes gene_type:complete